MIAGIAFSGSYLTYLRQLVRSEPMFFPDHIPIGTLNKIHALQELLLEPESPIIHAPVSLSDSESAWNEYRTPLQSAIIEPELNTRETVYCADLCFQTV